MSKTAILLALTATFGFCTASYAADNDANSNASKDMPASSTAATPPSVKTSPGTVGAMQDADKGSFTATPKEQGGANLDANKTK